ncbi:MAG: hypothetical protein KatS3mg054_0190 [Chloroflexus sp.]|nr:MAG: hypothetical protein KatS3mg054_0190 [Chloroflexus sp.]
MARALGGMGLTSSGIGIAVPRAGAGKDADTKGKIHVVLWNIDPAVGDEGIGSNAVGRGSFIFSHFGNNLNTDVRNGFPFCQLNTGIDGVVVEVKAGGLFIGAAQQAGSDVGSVLVDNEQRTFVREQGRKNALQKDGGNTGHGADLCTVGISFVFLWVQARRSRRAE